MSYPFKMSKCPLCDSIENLIVHHIDGNRKNNNPNNLINLCKRCHGHVTWDNKHTYGYMTQNNESSIKIKAIPMKKKLEIHKYLFLESIELLSDLYKLYK